MSEVLAEKTKEKISDKRILGSIGGDLPGPTVVILTGMHGNEPAGVHAMNHILNTLEGIEQPIRGNLLALRANIRALERNKRYIDEDMNRIWFPSIMKHVRKTPEDELESSERVELKRLLAILDEIKNNASDENPPILADVHTFSAEGWMFSITSSDPRQRKLLSNIHVPMVFGIEETLHGTALGHYMNKGFISFGLEGGQHRGELTELNTRSALILLLNAVGCIEKEYVKDLPKYEQHLRSHTKNLPVETELVYQHIIEPEDEFKMRPGYKNFQPVKKGEWLASDQKGRIHARCDGFILMPLYQNQGDDGFFIIREHES